MVILKALHVILDSKGSNDIAGVGLSSSTGSVTVQRLKQWGDDGVGIVPDL